MNSYSCQGEQYSADIPEKNQLPTQPVATATLRTPTELQGKSKLSQWVYYIFNLAEVLIFPKKKAIVGILKKHSTFGSTARQQQSAHHAGTKRVSLRINIPPCKNPSLTKNKAY